MNKEVLKIFKSLKKINARLYLDSGNLKLDVSKGNLTDELCKSIKTNKQEVIAFLEEKKERSYKAIPKTEKEQSYPLSHAQKRLWIICQIEEVSITYNLPTKFEINQDLNLDSFHKAVFEVFNRHEILRTAFKENANGEVKQWIINTEKIHTSINYQDLSGIKEKESFVESYITEDADKPFNLRKAPLLRLVLFKFSAKKHVLYLNLHHIIRDGWSLEILHRDIMAYYNFFNHHISLSLPKLDIQYKDFATWQLRILESKTSEKHKQYWLNKLKGPLGRLDFPTRKIRPKIKTYTGHSLRTTLPKESMMEVKAFCRKQNGSLFMGLVAVWKVVFFKYTQQTDIIIATPIDGRTHSQLENQIGFYVNTLILRNQLNPNSRFEDFFRDIKDSMLLAYEHQIYPFDKIVEDLELKQDLSRSPIFDVMIKMMNYKEKSLLNEVNDFKFNQIVEVKSKYSRFDFNIAFQEMEGHLDLTINYNPDVYEKSLVINLINHFKLLLTKIHKISQDQIGLIDILSPEERNRILFDFNNTKSTYSKHITLVDVLENRVKITPDNIAIIDDIEEITYQKLNYNCNQIAWGLLKQGIRGGDYVCLHLSRKISLIESLLGVIKTGAAYIPVEPHLPFERKVQIFQNLNIKVIIANSSHQELLLKLIRHLPFLVKIIFIDDLNALDDELDRSVSITSLNELRQKPSTNPECTISPLDEAYVIYTSGSTGQPKGVVVQHSPVVNLIEWVNQKFMVNEHDKLLMVSSIGFDLSVYDIFGMIHAGGILRIVSHEQLYNPTKLINIIYDESITFWNSAPTTLSQLIPEILGRDKNKINKKSNLRLVFLSGDWIPLSIFEDLKSSFPNVQIIGLGGATEATIWSNFHPILEIDPTWSSIPYGKPIQNAVYYILDSYLNPCPLLVEGDLYIAGNVLAKEYKNDKNLTAKKFISNPFNIGSKMYKTGDRARYFEDGKIEFLGRKDDQVKIRGHRVELGDIKYALEQNTSIRDVFVTTIGSKTNLELVAYFTKKHDIHIGALRKFITKKLPHYMVPNYFVPLDVFPKTANGKLDRSSLPEPKNTNTGTNFTPPTTDMEKIIVKIWSDVLKVAPNKIGITDNFFEIGGDSIKAMKVFLRINTEFQTSIDYQKFFFNPTIETLITYVKSYQLLTDKSETYVQGQDEIYL